MEAMARGKIVLAPAITGIPELVIHEKTGFLYLPGALKIFLARILFLDERIRGRNQNTVTRINWIRHAARVQVVHNFSHRKNLAHFCNRFLELTAVPDWRPPNEDSVL
jgi:glycosyltransferase involved in cell wall biosynthesis